MHLEDIADHLHVAAAVIGDGRGNVLIARRPDHLHQGGLWEFPGGKVETGEGVEQALDRELEEELGIRTLSARRLIRVPHRYPDRHVLLDVWLVDRFAGTPEGREGQAVRWVPFRELNSFSFPEANEPIVTAATLPDRYLITPEPGLPEHWEAFLAHLEERLSQGIELVQLRAKKVAPGRYGWLATRAAEICRRHGARLLLNGDPGLVAKVGADGVHLTSARLATLTRRPLDRPYLVAVSCHSHSELMRAHAIGADFAVVSPVLETPSHPEVRPLGWDGLHRLADLSRMPVYALGGMGPEQLPAAWEAGAQGIAAIRGIWES